MSDIQTGAADAPITDQTIAPDAPVDGGQPAQAQAPDPVAQRLDELSGQMQQFFQQQQAQQAQQPEDPYAGEPQFDPYTGQPVGQQFVDLTDPQQAQEYIQQQIQQGIQQGLAPVNDHMYNQEIAQLGSQYPDIFQPDVVQPVSQILSGMGFDAQQSRPPARAIEVAYKAFKADQIAQQQQPLQQGQGPALETGGAAPQGQEADPADMILGPPRAKPTNVFGI